MRHVTLWTLLSAWHNFRIEKLKLKEFDDGTYDLLRHREAISSVSCWEGIALTQNSSFIKKAKLPQKSSRSFPRQPWTTTWTTWKRRAPSTEIDTAHRAGCTRGRMRTKLWRSWEGGEFVLKEEFQGEITCAYHITTSYRFHIICVF